VGDNRRRTLAGRSASAFAILLVCACPSAPAVDPPITFVSHAILSGNARWIGNSCSRLVASVGQPTPGFSAGGGFTLSAGFRVVVPAGDGDTIFFSSVEECLP